MTQEPEIISPTIEMLWLRARFRQLSLVKCTVSIRNADQPDPEPEKGDG